MAPHLTRLARLGIVALFFSLGCGAPRRADAQARASIDTVVVKDWLYDVTPTDLGFNQLSGNVGAINKDGVTYARTALDCGGKVCGLRFAWDFSVGSDSTAFTGSFFSLAGLTSTRATFYGRTIEDVSFPEHVLDLDRVLGPVGPADGPRQADGVLVDLDYDGARPLMLRLELQDALGGSRFTRVRIVGSSGPQSLAWDFRQTGTSAARPFDPAKAKVLSLVIERENRADLIVNPDAGTLLLRRVAFRLDRPVLAPSTDEDALNEVARYATQYFLTSHARTEGACVGRTADGREVRHTPGAYGFAQDRSTFGDLLSVGATGFALPAYVIAAERGYVSRPEAVALTLGVLRVLANPAGFGPEPVGRLGYRGWFYHFLGCDGRRKLNFDFADTPDDESQNTVELATIDTGLLVAGVLVAQQYFNGGSPEEGEIRRLAQDIYDRVEWSFMLDARTGQFLLGWKPIEPRTGPPFAYPDRDGLGHYSGTASRPATLDYFTDEALLLVMLAAGSRTAPVPAPADLYCSLIRTRDASGLVRSWPGSLFTYFFLHAFNDTHATVFPACSGEARPIDWFANSRLAFSSAISYAERNSSGLATYGPDAWGISAAEGFDDVYRAYGVPPLAVANPPDQDGTVTYYGMVSAVSFGEDLRQRVINVVRLAWERGHWHPVVGLPDAFNDDICKASPASTVTCDENLLRASGPWVQWATFGIDQGPMALHLENARSGLVWQLFRENANVRRAIDRLTAPPTPPAPAEIGLEAEQGSGAGQVMQRSNASNARTVWLHSGETRTLAFDLPSASRYAVSVRYSNDNFGPLERVEVKIDGQTVGRFDAEDTGDFGAGWNAFRWAENIGTVSLESGRHQVDVTVSGGDGYGVEIDVIRLRRP